jgi:hypothetical protein
MTQFKTHLGCWIQLKLCCAHSFMGKTCKMRKFNAGITDLRDFQTVSKEHKTIRFLYKNIKELNEYKYYKNFILYDYCIKFYHHIVF